MDHNKDLKDQLLSNSASNYNSNEKKVENTVEQQESDDSWLFEINDSLRVHSLIGDGLQALVYKVSLLQSEEIDKEILSDQIHCNSSQQSKFFAVKIVFKNDYKESLHIEHSLYKKVQNDGICTNFMSAYMYMKDAKISATSSLFDLTVSSDENLVALQFAKTFDCLVLDLSNEGDLFTFVAENGPLELPLVRQLFNQLLDGVNYLHSKHQTAHLDLKLENILLMKNSKGSQNSNQAQSYIVKLCDLGFSHSTKELMTLNRGSDGYKAPEIYEEREIGYDPAKADMFALGVILFILVFGIPPFTIAQKDNSLYKFFYRGNHSYKYFFSSHPATKEQYKNGEIDYELIEIIMALLDQNPLMRPNSIEEILTFKFLERQQV
eukprot:403362027